MTLQISELKNFKNELINIVKIFLYNYEQTEYENNSPAYKSIEEPIFNNSGITKRLKENLNFDIKQYHVWPAITLQETYEKIKRGINSYQKWRLQYEPFIKDLDKNAQNNFFNIWLDETENKTKTDIKHLRATILCIEDLIRHYLWMFDVVMKQRSMINSFNQWFKSLQNKYFEFNNFYKSATEKGGYLTNEDNFKKTKSQIKLLINTFTDTAKAYNLADQCIPFDKNVSIQSFNFNIAQEYPRKIIEFWSNFCDWVDYLCKQKWFRINDIGEQEQIVRTVHTLID